ncbi:hypothetical protein BMS3Abin03_00474 [bacterium BMS3Abin03]|nr:hypothetical protein BMS3Abin03_00474 [bacterium BMS3Abin03]
MVKKTELKIVFDTNVLFTGSASDLINTEVAKTVKENSNHSDLLIKWYLPEVVIHERVFQMRKRGYELLFSIQKLEKLLGHNLNINEKIIDSRINETIENQIKENGFEKLNLSIDKIDWQTIINNSLYRKAPFEDSEKEKGFRDALIIESVCQLIADSPSTTKICRIVIVSNDGLLITALKERNAGKNNVRILRNVEELKGLINTLVSKVDEEFINKIIDSLNNYFFSEENQEGIFYKSEIQKKILDKYQKELTLIPESAQARHNNQWFISPPNFVKKISQRVYLSSRISVEATGFKYVDKNAQTKQSSLLSMFSQPSKPQGSQNIFQNLFPNLGKEKVEVKKGETAFDVIWSVIVNTNYKLSNPKIESINYIGTNWENA